ncbi:MAG: hypothetical protein RIQ88_429 [Actinomycetota bacterium]|jgi:DNA-binding response OmpR family regulator
MTITNNPFVRIKTEPRGFAIYVGIDEATAKANGTTLAEIVAAVRQTLEAQVPGLALESFAAVALAKEGTVGRNIDIVRKALGEPRTVAALNQHYGHEPVVIDLARRKVYVDGLDIDATDRELELLTYLVANPGENISREELIEALWSDLEHVEDRTIDVHVRRLRAKLGSYEDIIRTIRGSGYRFDAHPDVLIERG